jgi:hypothetical protein
MSTLQEAGSKGDKELQVEVMSLRQRPAAPEARVARRTATDLSVSSNVVTLRSVAVLLATSLAEARLPVAEPPDLLISC